VVAEIVVSKSRIAGAGSCALVIPGRRHFQKSVSAV
jgi:hypothetical protein